MTNIPDSGWLAAIQKVSWWVSAAIAVAATVVLALAYFEAPWFRLLPTPVAAGIGVAGVLFYCLLLFQGIDLARKRRRSKARRGVHQLSDQQRDFLMQVFSRGSRNFEIPAGSGSPRWLEELKNWNYIEWHSPIMFTADSPNYYSITEEGWRQLEKFQSKSR